MRVTGYDDVRLLARRRLPRAVFDFVDGGAGGERTLLANRAAFEDVSFDPRFLVDVARRDTSTTVLGEQVSLPILLAPAGLARLVDGEGELAAARAAGRAGTIFVVSTASSRSLEEIAEAQSGPLWFQLYLWRGNVSDELVARARAAGYRALVVTIDVPVVGNRERDRRNGLSLRPGLDLFTLRSCSRHPRWGARWLLEGGVTMANLTHLAGRIEQVAAFVDRELVDPSATWESLRRVRRRWDGPLVVKGVLSSADALEAVRSGADAVYVSNHGGRQLDGAPATLDVLPEIVEAIGDRAEVLIDGGVRRGEDAIKARALGARACLVGRPWLHALAAGGMSMLAHLLGLYRADVDRTLALLGVPRFDAIDARVVRDERGYRAMSRSPSAETFQKS